MNGRTPSMKKPGPRQPPPLTDLALLRPGELGLELLLALLMVSMRDDLVCSCLPAVDRGLFTAPRTLAAFGWRRRWGPITTTDYLNLAPLKPLENAFYRKCLTFPGVKKGFISGGR